MNIYSIQNSNGKEIATERQIYQARATAQAIANKTGREVSFASEHSAFGREYFRPNYSNPCLPNGELV